MKNIILLSGPVGAGKTTVAAELVKLAEKPVICIEGDVFWKFIAKGNPAQNGEQSFVMTISAMVAAALPYPRHGYDVIVDFSIPPAFLEAAFKMTGKKEIALHYVVLRPPEEVCSKRSISRVEGYLEYGEQYHRLYESFADAQRYTTPDETSGPAAIAAKVKEGLDEGMFLVSF